MVITKKTSNNLLVFLVDYLGFISVKKCCYMVSMSKPKAWALFTNLTMLKIPH